MSTHVIGFRPPDDEWMRMNRVYDACKSAGVDIPSEVMDFFQGEPPDPAGVEVELTSPALVEWRDENGYQGFEVHLDQLPPRVKILRFFNSW